MFGELQKNGDREPHGMPLCHQFLFGMFEKSMRKLI